MEQYKPRYDPTVIPIDNAQDNRKFDLDNANTAVPLKDLENARCDTLGYHQAFKKGTATPLTVAQTIVDLVEASAEHSKAFLSIQKSQLLAEAEASTKRYSNGQYLSILDGVPVGVKDEVDLEGHNQSFATSKATPCPASGTSWCVRKWQDAGAIIIGKLNMHELGLGKSNHELHTFFNITFIPLKLVTVWTRHNEQQPNYWYTP